MPEKRFCPNCGDDWVEPDTSNRAEIAFSGGNPNTWKCRNCGYTGIMPEGETEENIDFESGNDYPREDAGFGKGYLKYMIYVSAPALLLYGLYQLQG